MDDLRAKIDDLKFLLENGDFSPGAPGNAKDIAENIKLLCDEVQTSSSHFSKLFFLTKFFIIKQFLLTKANLCVDAHFLHFISFLSKFVCIL